MKVVPWTGPEMGFISRNIMHESRHSLFVHTCAFNKCVVCACFYIVILICRRDCRLLCLFLLEQMSGSPYVGFADGSSRSTCSFSSAAWVIYDPHGELVDIQGVCLGCTTNNVAEYSAVIELLA